MQLVNPVNTEPALFRVLVVRALTRLLLRDVDSERSDHRIVFLNLDSNRLRILSMSACVMCKLPLACSVVVPLSDCAALAAADLVLGFAACLAPSVPRTIDCSPDGVSGCTPVDGLALSSIIAVVAPFRLG